MPINFQEDSRFADLKPFDKRVWLSSPTMHGDEIEFVEDAYRTNWMSTTGANINELERLVGKIIGSRSVVALSSGTAALHLAIRLAAEKIYGKQLVDQGLLCGHSVFCSDLTFAATANPIAYENGKAIFIDSERTTWNMDPEALENAFAMFPDVRIVVLVHLYGTPSNIQEIKRICKNHNAILIEDAAESFGATYRGTDGLFHETGSFGDFSIISFNGNKIITGSSGGLLIGNSNDAKELIDKARKWSTQSRESVPWYEHKDLGYNYRISNIVAGIARGQLKWRNNHIEQKKKIYEMYKDGLSDLPVTMNPFDKANSYPNYWLSCMLINKDAMSYQKRSTHTVEYQTSHKAGSSCPSEILDALLSFNCEGRPVWKPMHLQPIYFKHPFVTIEGVKTRYGWDGDVSSDLFDRGLCLPSDNKMTEEEQNIIIDIIHKCFENIM